MASTAASIGRPGQGRRIGGRVAVRDVPAAVLVARRGRFGRVQTAEVAVGVEDLSVTGAGLVVPATAGLTVGSVIDLRLDGAWGQVRLRRRMDTTDPAWWFWGVEFVMAQGPFLEAISGRLGDDNPVSRGVPMRD